MGLDSLGLDPLTLGFLLHLKEGESILNAHRERKSNTRQMTYKEK